MGWTARRIARAVREGTLLHVRRGHYADPDTPVEVVRAGRVGGRLTCVSELRMRGVWVAETAPTSLHVHVAPNAARLRHEHGVRVHWSTLVDAERATNDRVSLLDALLAAAACLSDWELVAAMDSAVNRGDLSLAELRGGLAEAPHRIRQLVALVRPEADSGLESLVRLLAVDLGFRVALQVRYPGIGIADLVIEDWIVVETDGGTHDVPVVAARDRRRDARHAAAGRTALRFRYHQVVHELPAVAEAIIGAVAAHRRVRNSGERARRARIRLERLRLS
jgi:Uncharacterized protein conserved in bacteria